MQSGIAYSNQPTTYQPTENDSNKCYNTIKLIINSNIKNNKNDNCTSIIVIIIVILVILLEVGLVGLQARNNSNVI